MEENKVAEVMAEMYLEIKRLKECIAILEKEIASQNRPCEWSGKTDV